MRERPEAKRSANGRVYDPDRLFLPPDDDLAPNRPGETLRARLEASRRGRLSLALARLLGRRPVEDSWRRSLAAEVRVGAQLEGLTPGGWEVVHSLVLPGDAVIPHLLIGPGGVFCVQTEPVPATHVEVGEDEVRVGRERQPRPCVRRARRGAQRCAPVLSRCCGYPVPVRAVLVLAGAAEARVTPALRDVRVLREDEVAAGLGTLGGVLRPDRVDRIHTVARNRRVWFAA
ncbi:nuclease-related domain-containing protein [Streptomyces sp. NPDC049585]|uniref:nuclease-related domain-containing protein n=1 Tax=Streptomyces sp. NPDC049585 TaxID=3155154 RepID=UPI0034400D44